ncbi:carboxymuconolactone decarboxylase family protein [Cardiobacterium sp. Marseille-Q4385]|uniref:carboxymuconolactone decarboxylase family protein n=1 Tax=Cardiobacterium sp. Marseille-Q4385 TaxID=2866573 RepID=UPI001CE4228C|nr:carboxymuconolactone decarboxylase family protein [Cardiobacterium sp. Marseille-Q4385]
MRLHYSQYATATYQALLALEASLKLDNPLKDLIKIRVSQINGCVFCVDMHVKEAKLHGERELRLYHLPVWRESALFNDKERAALQWAETLTRLADHHVSDADYAAVRAHFDEEELVALTHVINTINTWNRLNAAFATPAGGMDNIMGLDKAGLK